MKRILILAFESIVALGFIIYLMRSHPWVLAILRRLPFPEALREVQSSVDTFKDQPKVVLSAVGVSLLVQLSMILSCLCFAHALGEHQIPTLSFFWVVPLVSLVTYIPVSPGGLGVRETAAFHALFEKVNYAHGGSLAILQRLSLYFWAFVSIALYLLRKKEARQAIVFWFFVLSGSIGTILSLLLTAGWPRRIDPVLGSAPLLILVFVLSIFLEVRRERRTHLD